MGMPKIERMYFEVTNSCTFNCDFCPSRLSKRKKQCMDFNLFKKGVDEIAKEKLTKKICFHILGEPLLYPRIFEAVKYVKTKGLQAEITSNGSLLDSKVIKKLIAAGLDTLILSIPLTKDEARAKSRNWDFKKYYKNIFEAVRIVNESDSKMNLKLRVMNNFTKKFFGVKMNNNEGKLQENLLPLISKLAESIKINAPPGEIRRNLSRININENKTILLKDNIGIEVRLFGDWRGAFDSKKAPARLGFCELALTNIGVLSNGEVVICCVDYDGFTSLGNLKSDSFVSLLNSKKAQDISKGFNGCKVVHPYCQKCIQQEAELSLF